MNSGLHAPGVRAEVLARASELRTLDVINITDGRRLGHVFDIALDVDSGQIRALVVPTEKPSWFSFFRQGADVEVPWDCVVKIGIDVILVELPEQAGSPWRRREDLPVR